MDSLCRAGCDIVATDIYPREYHPVVAYCDGFVQVPRVQPDALVYCQAIVDAAVANGCQGVVPLTDPEVDVLSTYREVLESRGLALWLAPRASIQRARSKEGWSSLLSSSEKVRLIPSYLSFDELVQNHLGKFVAKRVNGRSSEGILFSDTMTFGRESIYDQGYIFQPFIEGDVLTVDFARHPCSHRLVVLPRRELMRTKNGAGTVVEILDPGLVGAAVQEVTERLDLTGVMNCEFILHGGSLFLMDINPRFSAGVSFSRTAGYDFVAADIACYCQDDLPPETMPQIGKILVKRYCDFQ